MNTRVVWVLAATIALGAAARAAALAAPASYDAKAAPLDDLSRELLTDNGYELHDDGSVWDKISEAPVARDDMPYLLSRLASARRLRALLELNNIINRYDSERHLTPEDKEAVRALVRKNWIVFGVGPRNDFRLYFTPEELEALDQIPPRFDTMSPTTLTDPGTESVTALPPPAAPSPPAATPPPAAPAVAAPTPVSPAPTAVVSPPTPPAAAPPTPPKTPPAAAFTATPAAPPPSAAVVPPPTVSTGPAADLGVLKPWTPPAVSSSTAAEAPAVSSVKTATATPASPPPPPAPEPPKPAVVGPAEYAQFVSSGPYAKEGKDLLLLIGKRAPDYCLPLLRRTVVDAVPQIVFDGSRAGSSPRAGIFRDPSDPHAPPIIALSPGPVFVQTRQGLFGGRQDTLLPESPAAWEDLGVERPALDAMDPKAAPTSTEESDWGTTRVYADGSRRGAYSSVEQAGELLEQLLLVGLSREGLDASAYAARRWARTARLLFSARMRQEMRTESFLDPDRRAELRAWLQRPAEFDDETIAAWAASRQWILDPRRGPPAAERDFETNARQACRRAALADALARSARRRARRVAALEALTDAGVVPGSIAAPAAQAAVEREKTERARLLSAPPDCPAADAARAEGLAKAIALAAEAGRAEHALREGGAGMESHGP